MTFFAQAVIVGILFLVPQSIQAAESSVQKNVRTRIEALLKAANQHDLKAVASFHSEDYSQKYQDGRIKDKQTVMFGYARMFDRDPNIQFTGKIEKIEVRGSTARVTSTQTTHYTDDAGVKKQLSWRILEIWKQMGGKWLLSRGEEL